jgi:hypothetical protein
MEAYLASIEKLIMIYIALNVAMYLWRIWCDQQYISDRSMHNDTLMLLRKTEEKLKAALDANHEWKDVGQKIIDEHRAKSIDPSAASDKPWSETLTTGLGTLTTGSGTGVEYTIGLGKKKAPRRKKLTNKIKY